MTWLKVENLSFSFAGGQQVFADFSFEAKERGVYVVQGNSGVGKSTLSLLLSGHLKPNQGNVILSGESIKGPSRKVFLVSQEEDLFPWLKVKEQLEFFLQFSKESVDLKDALRWVELDDFDKYPMELSGGMRKRLSLLRACLLQPDLLILDETLSSIEVHLRARILNRFYPLWKKWNTGVFIISHDPLPSLDFPILESIRLGPSS